MAIKLNIQGTVVEIPSSGAAPNWSSGVIEAFQAIEGALQGVAGPFDVSPQILTIDAYNPGIIVDMPNFAFPTSDVRAVSIVYSVYRNTTLTTVVESGNLQMVYNPAGPVNNKWDVARDFVGDAQISFNVTDLGQVQFTTTTLSGSNHVGALSYQAKALLQD